MKKQPSLIDIINGRYNINEELKTYQFYKDEKDKEPVEIEAEDDNDADEKIKQITKKDPKKITKWRKTKNGEKPEMSEADDEDEDDYAPFNQDEWDSRFADEDGDYDDSPSEPQEEDITISDARGGGYSVGIVNGRHIGEFDEMEDALDAVRKWKEKNKFYPNTWWVSDHGNSWMIDDDGNEIKEVTEAKRKKEPELDYEYDKPVKAYQLKVDKEYVSIMGAEPLLVKYIGPVGDTSHEFGWVDNNRTFKLGPRQVMEYIRERTLGEITEENATSNLDGGEGQISTPFAFQHKPATRKEKQKEYSRATSSTGFGVVADTKSKYSVKLESMYKRVNQTIQESMVVGLPVVGSLSELKAKDPANKNREKVALKTLTMNPAMVGIMGGGGVDEAVKFLLSLGYTKDKLNKMAGRNIAEVTKTATPGEWVVYVITGSFKKTIVKVAPSYQAAKRILNKIPGDPKYSDYDGWGMTNRADWETEEGPIKPQHESIREGKYSEWANDPASTSKQKINKSIQEVNRRLYEIERMVNHVSKLKTESGLQQDAFWKQTMVRFGKISERLLRVGTKMRELNK